MRRSLFLLILIVLGCGAAVAGHVTSQLNDAFAGRSATERLPVLIALNDQVDAPAYARTLSFSGASLEEVHQQVMHSLRTQAETGQAAVLKTLDILAGTGMAAQPRPFWITSVIAAELNKAGADLVANMAEVDEVGLDEAVTLRKSFESTDAQPGRGAEGGLVQAGVREAWNLGYYGEGRLVCVVGDGAEAMHPALASHWKDRDVNPAAAWFDFTGSTSPSYCGPEATAMLGIVCGVDETSGDTLGMAPAARWIAAKVPCEGVRFSHVLAAWQWAADPDADDATYTDVPDAILNSWGLDSDCRGGVPQAAWYAVDNLGALGPLAIFGVTNRSSAAPGSVRAPESLASCFAVGNANTAQARPAMHASSGRGPSPCDALLSKPDMVAPGTSIRTSVPGGMASITGSGAAAAHTAGAAILLREANPNLSAADLWRILTTTATAIPGGDANSSGAGLLNIGVAVSVAMTTGNAGMVVGNVRFEGQPVDGARVTLRGGSSAQSAITEGGYFSIDHVPAERSYQVAVGRFGYKLYTKFDSVRVEPRTSTNLTINLERGFQDNADFDQAWSLSVEGDNATGGFWVRDIPTASRMNGKLVQPDRDASGDGYCFFTGNAAAATSDAMDADVDGGHTTLRSPAFSLETIGDPTLKFYYWYNNSQGPNPGSDFFQAQISNDGGKTWTDLINTSASTNGWTQMTVPITQFVAPTASMMLQFIATDDGPGSLIEAAVDAISITGTPTQPDAPRDLMLDVQPEQVVLRWRPSEGATAYKVYVGGHSDRVVSPENLYTTTTDTTLTIPMSSIPFNEFYFQVTAAK